MKYFGVCSSFVNDHSYLSNDDDSPNEGTGVVWIDLRLTLG